MNEEEKRAIEEYQRHTLECINYLVKTAESVGIEGVNQDVPISVETCVEIMRRLDAKIPKWIPVSERLPEIMDGTNGECSADVLICVTDDENITISTGFYGYYPRSTSLQGWWSMWAYGCHQLDSRYKVIAWMPLPEWHGGEK